MNGMFRVKVLYGTNLDFAVIQKQSRPQFTRSIIRDTYRPVCMWSIIYRVKPHFGLTLSVVIR